MAELNLVVNFCTLMIVAIVGGWQYYFVRSQLNSKDASIEALNSAITTNKAVIDQKEAEIAALKAKAAPALVKEHGEMQEYANRITESKHELELQMKDLMFKVAQFSQKQEQEDLARAKLEKLYENNGLIYSANTVVQLFGDFFFSPPESPDPHREAMLLKFTSYFEKILGKVNSNLDK